MEGSYGIVGFFEPQINQAFFMAKGQRRAIKPLTPFDPSGYLTLPALLLFQVVK
jgi:hypothetical protein